MKWDGEKKMEASLDVAVDDRWSAWEQSGWWTPGGSCRGLVIILHREGGKRVPNVGWAPCGTKVPSGSRVPSGGGISHGSRLYGTAYTTSMEVNPTYMEVQLLP